MLFITGVTHRLKLSFKVNAVPEAVRISELLWLDDRKLRGRASIQLMTR